MLDGCIAGAPVVDLCHLGDKLILEETGKVYKKEKEMKKGVRVCVCVCLCKISTIIIHACIYTSCAQSRQYISQSLILIHRYCIPYLCVSQQLCLPFLSTEVGPCRNPQ